MTPYVGIVKQIIKIVDWKIDRGHHLKMPKINVLISSLIFLSMLPAQAVMELSPEKSQKAIKVAYLGLEKAADFEQKIKSVFQRFLRKCDRCVLENYTPYAKNGQVDRERFEKVVKNLPEQVVMIFVNFNEVLTSENEGFRKALLQKAQEGKLLVGAAGFPQDGSPSAPLKNTLVGSIEKVAIVGDMGLRDRLFPSSSFYGPELLLAVRPPKEFLEQGVGPIIFSARWASELQKTVQNDWYNYFQQIKVGSRKLWMDVNDFF